MRASDPLYKVDNLCELARNWLPEYALNKYKIRTHTHTHTHTHTKDEEEEDYPPELAEDLEYLFEDEFVVENKLGNKAEKLDEFLSNFSDEEFDLRFTLKEDLGSQLKDEHLANSWKNHKSLLVPTRKGTTPTRDTDGFWHNTLFVSLADNDFANIEKKWFDDRIAATAAADSAGQKKKKVFQVKVLNPKQRDPSTQILHLKNFFTLDEMNRVKVWGDHVIAHEQPLDDRSKEEGDDPGYGHIAHRVEGHLYRKERNIFDRHVHIYIYVCVVLYCVA